MAESFLRGFHSWDHHKTIASKIVDYSDLEKNTYASEPVGVLATDKAIYGTGEQIGVYGIIKNRELGSGALKRFKSEEVTIQLFSDLPQVTAEPLLKKKLSLSEAGCFFANFQLVNDSGGPVAPGTYYLDVEGVRRSIQVSDIRLPAFSVEIGPSTEVDGGNSSPIAE